jgi:porin
MIGAALLLAAGASLPAADAPLDATAPVAGAPIDSPVQIHSHIHAGEQQPGHGPVLIDVTYVSDIMGVVSGGIKQRARYLNNLDVVAELDLEDMLGWRGAEMHVYGIYNNGQSISALVGDAQMVSSIESGTPAVKLYEAWIDQMLSPELSVRAGLYDLNSEFDVLESASFFVGGAHGMGSDIGMSGSNGPSVFPATGLGARIFYRPGEGWAIRAAVLEGQPGDPDHPARTVFKLDGDEGALLIGEVEAPLGDGRLLLGHWRYTATFDRFDGGQGRGNGGFYLRGETKLAGKGDARLDGFFRLGTANRHFNMFDRFASAGVKATGWIEDRPQDEVGLAVIGAFTSPEYRRAYGAERAEMSAEASYRTPLAPWLSVQPNVQYVRNPSADPTVPDAWVLGLRVEIGFRLLD